MATSSEDVLLSVGHVRYKKGDGNLYVMNQRLAWMLEHRDTVAVSHKYADIKSQKISPAGKPKVQLQVVLHDGTCSTFHFVNPAGPEAQAADRDKVKLMLQNLLPKFKRQIDKALEEKSRLLQQHPHLRNLYEDLVISKVLNSEEYWSTPTLKSYTDITNSKQQVGVSGAFLADIQPQTDGCNGLKYNLTQDIIDAIFKTYPAVRKKHTDYVPNKMPESEFWTKFFQSHYFHRDRLASSSSKDVFTECARLDDAAILSAMRHSSPDLTVDLPRHAEQLPLLPATDEPEPNKDSVHRNMIKRFNQHSIMVLKASQKPTAKSKPSENGAPDANGGEGRANGREGRANGDAAPPEKRRRILDKIHYEDLESPDKGDSAPELQLSKVERYLQGPATSSAAAPQHNTLPLQAFTSICQAWCSGQVGSRPVRVGAAAAVAALGELSPGGALLRRLHAAGMAQMIPADIKSELLRLYMSCGELLRELWYSLPQPGDADAETRAARAARFYEALLRFRSAKLRPFEEKIQRDLSPLAGTLTRHLNQMVEHACARYTLRMQRHTKR